MRINLRLVCVENNFPTGNKWRAQKIQKQNQIFDRNLNEHFPFAKKNISFSGCKFNQNVLYQFPSQI